MKTELEIFFDEINNEISTALKLYGPDLSSDDKDLLNGIIIAQFSNFKNHEKNLKTKILILEQIQNAIHASSIAQLESIFSEMIKQLQRWVTELSPEEHDREPTNKSVAPVNADLNLKAAEARTAEISSLTSLSSANMIESAAETESPSSNSCSVPENERKSLQSAKPLLQDLVVPLQHKNEIAQANNSRDALSKLISNQPPILDANDVSQISSMILYHF